MRNKTKIIVIVASVIAIALIAALVVAIANQIDENKHRQEELTQLFYEHYNNRINLFIDENKNYSVGEVDIAFIGDSLTEGYDVSSYYQEYKVVNRGIGGDTTHGLLARLDESIYQISPKVVVMLIGANNFQTMFENYEELIISIKQNLPDSYLVICSLTSMGKEWGRNNHLAAFNNVKIKSLAQKHECPFVDLYTPLLNMETNEIFEHYTTDGGHLTADGYKVLTENIKPVVDGLLNKNSTD